MIQARCPHCGSEHTQAVPVLVAQGTATGALGGSGLSLSGGGLGVGASEGTLHHQTELARRFMPPPPPAEGCGTLVMAGVCAFLAFIAMAGEAWGCGALLGLLALLAFLAYLGHRLALVAEREAWKAKVARLEAAWFCHRCGHDWVP